MTKKIIFVRVITRASRQEIIEEGINTYKAKLCKNARDGKANEELIDLLAENFSVPKSHIEIVKGSRSKNKIIELVI